MIARLPRASMLIAAALCGNGLSAAEIVVAPAQIDLLGWRTTAQLQVTLVEQGRRTDVTREAEWVWQGPANVVAVDDRRQVTAEADGRGTLVLQDPFGLAGHIGSSAL